MNAVTQTGQVPVSHERHGGRCWRRFTSYAFARSLHCVPVVLAELDPAAASFPVVFAEDAQGMMPVALLHLRRDADTPFVAGDGSWRGTYVPSALRAHPFSASATGAGDEMALLVDEGSGLVTDDPHDEPFFAEDGTPSEPLGQVIAFFRTRALSERDTRTACAALGEAGLLAPLRPLPGMDDMSAQGLFAVDPEKLQALPDSALPGLWHEGALRLAQAHRLSLHHASWMARALSAAPGATAPAAPAPAPDAPGSRLSDFLSAVADARDRDNGEQG
ncbi:SapC family protein [Roseovarius ramblicola]|uniref:SapC family protein n=1 Tax=Roseovarius ramblicola TaxID=2022336 RepID=A0ABV5I196_9RHOB